MGERCIFECIGLVSTVCSVFCHFYDIIKLSGSIKKIGYAVEYEEIQMTRGFIEIYN